MKTLRYIFALLLLTLTSLASAQVVEFHVNEKYFNDGQTHVNKYYLSQIDSIVYQPALDWTPFVEVKDFYEDEQEQVHVRVHATTGPNADFARLYFAEKAISSSYFSSVDVFPERDTLTNYTVLDKGSGLEMDFVLPDSTQKYWVTLATANLRYYPRNYRRYVTTQCLIDYAYWQELMDWEDLGMATYREDMVTGFFSVDNVKYNVPIQKNKRTEGVYRLVNPYGSYYPYNSTSEYDANAISYWLIHAEDPDYVWLETHNSTMDWGYGNFRFSSMVGYLMDLGNTLEDIKASQPESFGKFADGVITMPERGMVISMTNYNDGGWRYANRNGFFAIALPGATIKDYSAEARFVEFQYATTEDEKSQAIVEFTLSPRKLLVPFIDTPKRQLSGSADKTLIKRKLIIGDNLENCI
ncbi:MAG: hypothetical protein IJ197_06165 [Bacteroidaceae bacterium]|nr:hypothetical protein [Bacteroidaceae bacterium]